MIDFKSPIILALGAALAASLAGNVALSFKASSSAKQLAQEQAARATAERNRAVLVATDEKQVAGAERQHATDQQGIAHELAQAKQALAVAAADGAAFDRRLRDTAAQLTAARSQLQARSHAAAAGSCEHQLSATYGLLDEGFQLSVEAGGLAREGGRIVAERDAEVKALAAQVAADRALLLRASGKAP